MTDQCFSTASSYSRTSPPTHSRASQVLQESICASLALAQASALGPTIRPRAQASNPNDFLLDALDQAIAVAESTAHILATIDGQASRNYSRAGRE